MRLRTTTTLRRVAAPVFGSASARVGVRSVAADTVAVVGAELDSAEQRRRLCVGRTVLPVSDPVSDVGVWWSSAPAAAAGGGPRTRAAPPSGAVAARRRRRNWRR